MIPKYTKMKVKLKILIIILLILTICFIIWSNNKKMKITPEGGIVCEGNILDQSDSIEIARHGSRLPFKAKTYLISGYKNTPGANDKIDEFACMVIDPDFDQYYQYEIDFSRSSIRMNNRKIKGDCGLLYDYSNEQDFICLFRWFNGKFDTKIIKGEDNNDIFLHHFNCQ